MVHKKSKSNKRQKKQSVSSKEESDNQFIGHYGEAPSFMKDNQDITHGYRIGFNTPKKILKSLFMAHNQTVNIWTHFFPALLLICIICYLLWYFTSNQLIMQFQNGKQKLYESISSYSQALNKYAVVVKMKEMTSHQFQQIQNSLLSSYNDFREGAEIWKKNAETAVNDFGISLKQSAFRKFHQIQTLKMEFENQFVPSFLNQIINKIDPDKLIQINKKLEQIKEQLDSENFKYLELLHKKTGVDQSISRWPIFIFLFSALVCLLGSASFHLFYPMSGKAYKAFCRLDYAGINILISGSSFPALYYSMYCTPEIAAFYLIFIVSIGLSLFIFSLFQFLHRPQNLVIKSCAYGGFGVSLIIPLGHAIINQVFYNNYGDSFSFISSADEYFAVGFSYLLGLYIYTIRCPQRKNPGRYNICGHSHQIWHCMVVLGIIFTYLGAIDNLSMRRNSTCPTQMCSAMIF